MALITTLFLILSTGLFLGFLLLLIDHPKKIAIGLVIYAFVILFILMESSLAFILFSIVSSPLVIFLDYKRISWMNALVFVIGTIVFLFIFKQYLVYQIPFYIYPVMVFAYVYLARKKSIPHESHRH